MSRERSKAERLLFFLWRFAAIFLLLALVITVCMTLFLRVMERNTGVFLTEAAIKQAAIATFVTIIILTALAVAMDGLRRRRMIDRPVRRIAAAAEKIMEGDFSVRVQPVRDPGEQSGLNAVIGYFNRMAEELSGVETLRADFISNVSHELKTPLAVMQNYGVMLQQPGLSEEKRMEYAGAVTRSCRRLAELVTNILKLNKLENQQIYPAKRTFDLGEQLCRCLLDFESVWEEKEIDLVTAIQEDVPVQSDPELLELVWRNLFSNALKFTGPGGRVTVTLRTEEEMAVVTVQDTGCGISPETGRHIFEKFYQGDPSHATQGNGLGLALVKRAADIVGGDISVSSQLGKGSAFTVKLRRNANETG